MATPNYARPAAESPIAAELRLRKLLLLRALRRELRTMQPPRRTGGLST